MHSNIWRVAELDDALSRYPDAPEFVAFHERYLSVRETSQHRAGGDESWRYTSDRATTDRNMTSLGIRHERRHCVTISITWSPPSSTT
jgi:hypothetical protein